MTITASVTYDQVVVASGAQVIVAPSVTHTLADGPGTDLTINGTWLNSGGTWTATGTWLVGAGGTYVHNTASGVSSPLDTATLDPASTFIYRGSSTVHPAISVSNRTYGNLSIESTSGSWTANPNGAGPLTVNGDFSIGTGVTYNNSLTGVMTFAGNFTNNGALPNGANTQIYTFTGVNKTIGGTGTLSLETFTVNSGASITLNQGMPVTILGNLTNNGTLTLSSLAGGDLILYGDFVHGGTFNSNGRAVYFRGASVQHVQQPGGITFDYMRIEKSAGSVVMGSNLTCLGPTGNAIDLRGTADELDLGGNSMTVAAGNWGGTDPNAVLRVSATSNLTLNGTGAFGPVRFATGGQTLANLTINRSSGNLTLGSDLTVNGVLNLQNGLVVTGVNTLFVGSAGTITGAGPSRYVDGKLNRRVTLAGAVGNQTWDIGDDSRYTPVDLYTSSGTQSFDLTWSTTPGDHPSLASSNLSADKTVNRYYTGKQVLTTGGFGSVDLTFHFDPADVDPGSDPTTFIVKKYDAPYWTDTGGGVRTSTSTLAASVTSFSDFAIGTEVVSSWTYTPLGSTTIVYDKTPGCGACGRRSAVVEGQCSDFTLDALRNPRCTNNCVYGYGCPAPSSDFFSNSSPFLDRASILGTLGNATILMTGTRACVLARPSTCGNGTEYASLPSAPDLDAEGQIIVQAIFPGDTVSYPPFAPIENVQGGVCPSGIGFCIVVTELNPKTRAILHERLLPVTVANLQFNAANGCPAPSASELPFQVDPVDWLNDTFPANEISGLPGTADFDSTGALIKTGRNTAQPDGTSLRFDIPGDTLVANTPANEPAIRMDLVFRILPGPGNYQIAAGRSKPPGGPPTGLLLQVPTNQTAVAVPGDGSFWGQYMSQPGEFSAGDHHGHTSWDPNTWNSARMDTAELNLFPVERQGNLPHLTPGAWASMYHELDPKFSTLGLNKFRCFVADTAKSASNDNVSCNGGVPAWLSTVPHSRTGWDGTTLTKEFTKILPDGLFTPGTHIEYFVRKSSVSAPTVFTMNPDTNVVTPQRGKSAVICGGDDDGRRWQEMNVLPDRWKATAFGGEGLAQLLYVNLDDRGGDERAWTTAAELIGATTSAKFGAHDGWHAPSMSANPNDPANFVRPHIGQAGSMWDRYEVRGAGDPLNGHAGALGSRLANRGNMGFASGKASRIGPTREMLGAYYRMLYVTTGALRDRLLGPGADRSQDDITLLGDFLTQSGGMPQPRGLWVQGDGFAESERNSSVDYPVHGVFLTNKLGMMFRASDYRGLSGNGGTCPAVFIQNQYNGTMALDARNCEASNVLNRNPALPEALESSFYDNVGTLGPYVAGVVKQASAPHNWITLTDGWDLKRLRNAVCDAVGTSAYDGAFAYYVYKTLSGPFGALGVSPLPPHSLPDPSHCQAPHIVLGGTNGGAADSLARFSVVVRNPYGELMPRTRVGVTLGPGGGFPKSCDGLMLSSDQRFPGVSLNSCDRPIAYATTDSTGTANFVVLGSGSAANRPTGDSPPCGSILIGDGGDRIGVPVAAFDEDGTNGVGANDLSLWLEDFGAGSNNERSDFDGNGSVSANDLSLLSVDYFAGTSTNTASRCDGAPTVSALDTLSGGLRLAWNDCRGNGGAALRTFACNTNSGSNSLIASVKVPSDVTNVTGIEAGIDVYGNAGEALPSWWHLETGGCRAFGLSTDINAGAGCLDLWQGRAVGVQQWDPPTQVGAVHKARYRMLGAVAPRDTVILQAGTEWYLFKLNISNTKTTGTGFCADCAKPVALMLRSVRLTRTAGLPDKVVYPSQVEDSLRVAYWQGAPSGFTTAVEPHERPISAAWLGPAMPNPSRGPVTIGYALPRPSRGTLAIYDLAGRRVRALSSGMLSAGQHREIWDGRSDRGIEAQAGVYYYRLLTDSYDSRRTLIKLR